MIREFIKKWFGLYDINDLVMGARCGHCGDHFPQEICSHNCAKNIDLTRIKDVSIAFTALLLELRAMEAGIEATTFTLPLEEVWSRLRNINMRYKIQR